MIGRIWKIDGGDMSETYRDDNCLEHMIDACRKIRRIVSVARADYDKSEEKQLALERLFEIVGEAASRNRLHHFYSANGGRTFMKLCAHKQRTF